VGFGVESWGKDGSIWVASEMKCINDECIKQAGWQAGRLVDMIRV
jgi:hypothetical protein